MNIILTVHQFFPDYSSGTEVLTYSVAKALLARGHKVTVFTGFPAKTMLADHERFDQYELEGVSVHRFHHAHVPMGTQTSVTEIEHCNILAASYFRHMIERERPDVVHYFHLSRLSALLIDVSVALGIPSFFTPTDFWMICPTSQLLLNDGSMCKGPSAAGGNCIKHVAQLTRDGRLARALHFMPNPMMDALAITITKANFIHHPLRPEIVALSERKNFLLNRLNALDKIIAPTQLMQTTLIDNGVDSGRILLSAYGIDTEPYAQQRRVRSASKRVCIGFIGTLSKHKGCHVLIDAVKLLSKDFYSLKIYGDPTHFPDYYSTLTKLAAENENIEFCGTFPNAQIGQVLDQFDVLVVPSLWYENTPLVIYSALASGCPAIVSDFPGMTEAIKHEVNGLSFEPGNHEALAQNLKRLSNEPELLTRLSNQCQPPKSSVSYTDELLELYEKALSAASKKSIPNSPAIPPYDIGGKRFSISGWAFPLNSALAHIALIDNGSVIAETTSFGLRSDVLEGFKANRQTTKSGLIGFSLAYDAVLSPKSALHITCSDNATVVISLATITQNKVTHEKFVFLGIDKFEKSTLAA